jgi:hypothetical protein
MSGASEVYISEHNMIQIKHHPYSPDLARSDFYSVPTFKDKLKNIDTFDEEVLFYRL